MQELKSHILRIVIAGLSILAIIVAGILGYKHADDPICQQVNIIIQDSTERQYITCNELKQLLADNGLWQIGEHYRAISCHDIEQRLLMHPMLSNVQCYKKQNGNLTICVRQRIPILRVEADEHYYIDSKRCIMPVRASITTPVIIVNGHVGKQQAQTEIFDFVCQIANDKYWRNEIKEIHVVNPKMIELKQQSNGYVIILGPLDNAWSKLDKLKKLYTKGFDKIGWPPYKQIDLRYDNQIIGRK